MIIDSKSAEKKGIERVAEIMCIAARTAPKARGVDNIVSCIIRDETKEKLAKEMEEIGKMIDDKNFFRDAKNVRDSELVVLIGTKLSPLGLNCRMCRFSCEEVKEGKAVCGFNLNDLGIAIGSAVSIAADFRVDNRIMYRIGVAVQRLKLLCDGAKIVFGIPLSATGKNIFFDRE